jgi:hypothetical protein
MRSLALFLLSIFILFFPLKIFGQSIAINEILASNSSSNSDEDGDYEDWIELYNFGSEPINLNRFGLSDDENTPFKWVFPNVTLAADSYMLIWASDKNRTNPAQPLHTNFKISANGETIILTHSNGTLLNKAPATALQTNFSLGRLPNGTGDFVLFQNPTPERPNIAENQSISPPDFSHVSGFYSSNISLVLSHSDPNATMVYTTDGSEPNINNISGTDYQYKNIYHNGPFITETYRSNKYSDEILLQDKTAEPNKLANISTTLSNTTPNYFPKISIPKANVIKAKAYVNGIASSTISHTYFISSTNSFNHSLPVISITVDENNLFDYHDGIYVAGIDNLNSLGENRFGFYNWNRDTELIANFQYFENQRIIINQNIGLRIHGSFTRTSRLKSLRLYARSDYDENNTFDFPFFENYSYSSFKRLILRNSGNDGDYALFRDAFMQRLVRHLNFEIQEYRPVVHYLNGEYWGILNLRERYDRHYFERVYGIAEGDLDFLELDGRNDEFIKEGDNVNWKNFFSYMDQNDLSLTSNYNYVVTQMDEVNFMDYQIANIYFGNTDWPGNNVLYFRKKTANYEPNAPYGQDGRWRWVLNDTDFGFGLYNSTAQHNTLEFAATQSRSGWPNLTWPTLFLRKLLENESFKIQFINRYADILNTAFIPERAISLINQMKDVISSEIPNHRNRWAIPTNWESQISIMINYANQRPGFARQHIEDFFDISGNHRVQVNVSDNQHGHIKINSIAIESNTPGVAENPYPWTGVYFYNIPISVKAIPATGYAFSHWAGSSESKDDEITFSLSEDISLTAHFVEKELENDESELLYFWLMDNELPNDTPLESLEPTYVYDNDLNKAIIYFESSLEGYPFDSSHPNWRKASMERRNKPTSLNYIPKANDNIAFEDVNMRGLQIKQPFKNENAENTLYVKMNIIGFESMKLSFAVVDEGAAQKINVDYYDASAGQWSVNGLSQDSFPISNNYGLVVLDFSSIASSNQYEDFMVRIRFDGDDMAANNGDRVTFNNISVSGIYNPVLNEVEISRPAIVVYPNPFEDHLLVKTNGNPRYTYQLFDMNGRELKKGNLINDRIDTGYLSAGVYILILYDNISFNRFKLLKR